MRPFWEFCIAIWTSSTLVLEYQPKPLYSILQTTSLSHNTAYAALELAYKKLGEVGSDDDNVTLRAK